MSVAASLLTVALLIQAQRFRDAQRHVQEGSDKFFTHGAVCAVFLVVSLVLWFGVRSPVSRGIALGIIGFPLVLAWFGLWLVR